MINHQITATNIYHYSTGETHTAKTLNFGSPLILVVKSYKVISAPLI